MAKQAVIFDSYYGSYMSIVVDISIIISKVQKSHSIKEQKSQSSSSIGPDS